MTSLESARDRILASLVPLPDEIVPVAEAASRVCSATVVAPLDHPGFDNSAMDGYAVRSRDCATATPGQPVRLALAGRVATGDSPTAEVLAGACVRMFTGAPLPSGADAVVMQEDTRPGAEGTVEILEPVAPRENVRYAGEDIRRGSTILDPGQRLRPGHLALLAAVGVVSLRVHRRPRVTLVTTGDELLAPGQSVAPGKIPNSNRILLLALAQAAGANVVASRHVGDDLEATVRQLTEAARESDVIVTTGGVSVGEGDFVKAAIETAGGSLELWRIALKPGKPFAAGTLGSARWFGLPGNPVSAFVAWHLLVRPALRKLEGDPSVLGRRYPAQLAERIANPDRRRHFVRVTVDGDGRVRLSGTQASHRLSGLAAANALLDIPPATVWEAGRVVDVESLD